MRSTLGTMRGAVLVPLLVVIPLLISSCAQAPASAANDTTVIAALVRERLAAGLAGDTARWHRLVSDSCLFTGPALRVVRTRDVLPAIVANREIRPAAQQIVDLEVHITGDAAQATYVQLVQDAGQAPEAGKRFRKTDTFARRGDTWLLIGGAEVYVPYRRSVRLDADRSTRLGGRYALGSVDTLTIAAASSGRFVLSGTDGTADTLVAENDSTLFEDGDAGSWIFASGPGGAVRVLMYRMAGSADVVLTRVPER